MHNGQWKITAPGDLAGGELDADREALAVAVAAVDVVAHEHDAAVVVLEGLRVEEVELAGPRRPSPAFASSRSAAPVW